MNLSESISSCFSKFATFSGRASRAEFWWFQLFCWFILQINTIVFLLQVLVTPDDKEMIEYVQLFCDFIFLIPMTAVASRRLHDIGKSGWWQLLMITVIGFIPLVIWLSKEGDDFQNNYGEPTK